MMKKSNYGFTLVELVVTIAVASIVMLAATTVLTSYMRISKQGSDINAKQSEVRILLEVMEHTVSEKRIKVSDNNQKVLEILENGNEQTLFYFDDVNDTIYSDTAVLMEGVEKFQAHLSENLLMLIVETENGEYATSVYCRLVEEDTAEPANVENYSLRRTFSESQTTDWAQVTYAVERENFLSILEAEVGSNGASVTTGEYFSEWYIGNYADNPGWDTHTPWCACFVSWAMDRCNENLAVVPRYANVEEFRNSFNIASWKTQSPEPGDIIFFDWLVNSTDYAQHVGVVTSVENGMVHTIEGNVDGEVARRVYLLDDPHILGYGELSWK